MYMISFRNYLVVDFFLSDAKAAVEKTKMHSPKLTLEIKRSIKAIRVVRNENILEESEAKFNLDSGN